MKNANLEEALSLLHRATNMQATAADCVAQATAILRDQITQHSGVVSLAAISARIGALPVIDQDILAVHWEGRTHEMGDTILLRLLARLARRPGAFVCMSDLLQDVWDGNIKSPSTVRSAVKRLRRQLNVAGMRALADAIRCEGGRYGLVLNGHR